MTRFILLVCTCLLLASCSNPDSFRDSQTKKHTDVEPHDSVMKVQLGPRPYFLIDDMSDSPLKEALVACQNQDFKASKFSIGHRGAPLQFPEHTKESYRAAARMGAGILECDVTFTKDKELVCRHSQCDLHSTTNILNTSLAAKCSTPPKFDEKNQLSNAADIRCCTSDISLAEFKSLTGKMDAANTRATSLEEYMNATSAWRTDLYASKGTLMTLTESIDLMNSLGVDFTPELKSPAVTMPYSGQYSQEMYAQAMIDAYIDANIPPERVWPQSFNYEDILYWLKHTEYGHQAVYLLEDDTGIDLETMKTWRDDGIKVIAPAMWMLLTSKDGAIAPSQFALDAKALGFTLLTWTVERSGHLANPNWYYQTLDSTSAEQRVFKDGDAFEVIDVLAKEVGVIGVFSDWPATTTYYAGCMGL